MVPGTVFASLNELRDPFIQEEKVSGLYTEEGYLLGKSNRPAINPDLDVDEDCKFDSYQIKCQPGSEQECPWRPGTNEDDSCVPNVLTGIILQMTMNLVNVEQMKNAKAMMIMYY